MTTGLTPEELRQIRRIAFQTGRRVDSLFAGGYRSAFKGQGMEFDEVRPYVPGDDIRRLDWNVTARAGSPHVKQFKEEREQTLMLALDLSGSMAFGSGGRDGRTDKRLLLSRLAGGLAFAAVRNNDRVGMLAFTDRVERFVPPARVRGHAFRVIREVFGARPEGQGTDLELALGRIRKVLKRRAEVVVISDFLSPKPYLAALGSLAARHRVHALVLHDPVEAQAPPVGLVDLVDAETGERRLVDAAALIAPVSVARRVEGLRRAGAWATPVATSDDPFRVLQRHFEGAGR